MNFSVEPTQKSQPEIPETLPELHSDAETLKAMESYLHHFYMCYKNFYGDIQKIPVAADEYQARNIRRQLVEMGLHALSFARAAKLKKLHRRNDEPNITLVNEHLQVDQLEPGSFRMYNEDPYQTEKRYHILRKIFQEMDLDHLNVLVEKVYISPEFLKKP